MGTSCSDVCEIFAGLFTVTSGGKVVRERMGGLEENVSVIFSGLATAASRGKGGQGEWGEVWRRCK